MYIKETGNSFFTNINNVANENYFYDDDEIDNLNDKKQFLEKYFHPLENRMTILLNCLLQKLKNREFKGFSNEVRKDISLFIVYQFMRTKEQRETIGELTQKIGQLITNETIRNDGGDPSKYKLLVDDKYFHTRFLLDNELMNQLAEKLLNRLWVVLENKTSQPFMTSDNPVCKFGHLGNEARSLSGFNSPGVEISFPLSPKYLLSIVDEKLASCIMHLNNKIIEANEQHILHYNSLQIIKSYNQIFSNQNAFSLADEILEEEPLLKNKNRERINNT